MIKKALSDWKNSHTTYLVKSTIFLHVTSKCIHVPRTIMIGLYNKRCIVICYTTHILVYFVNIVIAFIAYVQNINSIVYLVNLSKALGGDSIYLLMSSSLTYKIPPTLYIILNKTRAKWPWHPGIRHDHWQKYPNQGQSTNSKSSLSKKHTQRKVVNTSLDFW